MPGAGPGSGLTLVLLRSFCFREFLLLVSFLPLLGRAWPWSRVLAKELRISHSAPFSSRTEPSLLETAQLSESREESAGSRQVLSPPWELGTNPPRQHSAFFSPALSQVGVPSRSRSGQGSDGPHCGLFPYPPRSLLAYSDIIQVSSCLEEP